MKDEDIPAGYIRCPAFNGEKQEIEVRPVSASAPLATYKNCPRCSGSGIIKMPVET
jgi:hypothetical protein